jgi:hypothetical protein
MNSGRPLEMGSQSMCRQSSSNCKMLVFPPSFSICMIQCDLPDEPARVCGYQLIGYIRFRSDWLCRWTTIRMNKMIFTVRRDDQCYRRIKGRTMGTCWTVWFNMVGCAFTVLDWKLASTPRSLKYHLLLLPVHPASHRNSYQKLYIQPKE